MNLYNYILLVFVFILLTSGSCEYKEGQRFIIQNDSEYEIIITHAWFSVPREYSCLKSTAKFENENLIRDATVQPYSSRNFERNRLGEEMFNHPNDTLYVYVFYRTDFDAMSCEEFEQSYPLKKEWKVTLSDMQAADWTLVYTP